MEGKWDTSKRLSEVLFGIMREEKIGSQILENRAVNLWQVIVGPTVGRVTKNVYIKNGTLYVQLTSSVVKQELIMLKSKIINKINEAVGTGVVKDIYFT